MYYVKNYILRPAAGYPKEAASPDNTSCTGRTLFHPHVLHFVSIRHSQSPPLQEETERLTHLLSSLEYYDIQLTKLPPL